YFDRPSEQGVCKEFVFSDSFALVTGPSHPSLPTNPTIDDIAALDFISFGSDYDEYDPFFKVLKQHPNYRPSRFTSPNMLGTFCMVSASNLAIVAPLLLSQSIARQIPLTIHKIHDMPESVDLYLYWRETDSEDQSHRWFRELVKNLISNSKIQSPFFGPDTNDAEANTVYSILSKTMKENAGNRKRYSIESSTV
ncbi:MAG: LysR substrate-binding domain-containing protein, partial [Gammaproteobacteria bacterium]